jgi:hypothetical protein
MPNIQELLQAVLNMQSDAQGALPVIPNNGNPAGANNMPHTIDAPPSPVPVKDWSKGSPSMDNIRALLARPIQRGQWLTDQGYDGPMPGTQELQDARAAGEHPIAAWLRAQRGNVAPVLPMPANTGVVGPQYQNPLAPKTVAPILPERRRDTNPIIVR